MFAEIGALAPNIKISEWVQGIPTNIDKLRGNVVVLEVFQVNCPGCFLYGLPQSISLYDRFKKSDVKVIGLATAFEDYGKNTLDNLKSLLTEGKVIGETYKTLRQHGKLVNDDKLYYKIPFPVAMDKITKMPENISEDMVKDFIEIYFSDYKPSSEKEKGELFSKVRNYLRNKEYSAETFELYKLRGTPSSIIIDQDGILRYNFFGSEGYLEGAVKELLENR
ncbi:MAG: redoxin domain-containing protein [Thermoproteota archaeon]|nr:redoxin domain-containing protein [Thermoproteota archaeon]MDP9016073.1 redoxin domain-containing protein [Thermoproteota archaeon]